MTALRVLVVTRDDHAHTLGGDAVMVRQLQKHFATQNVQLEITHARQLPLKPNADIVHLTFLHLLESAEDTLAWAQRHHVPLVITPLFEESLPMWFHIASQRRGHWQQLRKVIGYRAACSLYIGWHTARAKWSDLWRRQRQILMNTHVVTNSRYERDHLAQWFALPQLNADVVPLGIDADAFNLSCSRSLLDDLGDLDGFVLEVARIETRKNQSALLEALSGSSLPIVLMGQPSQHEVAYVEQCRTLAKARGNVFFLEQVSATGLLDLYTRAAVHVLPSWSERPGLVTLEAAARGCRVVSTQCSPIHEYLGNAAHYCRPDDAHSIRSAIDAALTQPKSSALRDNVMRKFTWAQTAQQMLAVYQEILS